MTDRHDPGFEFSKDLEIDVDIDVDLEVLIELETRIMTISHCRSPVCLLWPCRQQRDARPSHTPKKFISGLTRLMDYRRDSHTL